MIKLVFGRSSRHDSAVVTLGLAEDHDRIAQGLNDVVVRRLFAVGLDLQTALGLVSDHRVADQINHAIGELDQAIRDIRETIFDRASPPAAGTGPEPTSPRTTPLR